MSDESQFPEMDEEKLKRLLVFVQRGYLYDSQQEVYDILRAYPRLYAQNEERGAEIERLKAHVKVLERMAHDAMELRGILVNSEIAKESDHG